MFRKTPIERLKEEIKQRFINSTDFKALNYTFQDQNIELLYLSSVCDEKK